MPTATIRQTVRELVEPIVQREGFDLVAVEWMGDERGPVLRLSVEGPGGGVNAADCARISRNVEPLMDEADPIQGRYILEVSSPGIDRPVQRLADFRRFKGYRIRIRLEEGHPRRRYTGEIAGVDDQEVLLQVGDETHRLLLDTIDRAHLVLELEEFQRLAEVLHDDE